MKVFCHQEFHQKITAKMQKPTSLHQLLLLLFPLFLTLPLSQSNQIREEASCPSTPAARIINHLSRTLTNQIGGTDNLFFSPLSISLALGMTYLGANSTTAEQIRTVLQYQHTSEDDDPEDVHLHFQALMSELVQNAGDQYTLLMANGLFPQTGFEMLPDFQSKLHSFYGAQSTPLDFVNDGNGATEALNDWVSNKTERKIPRLFEEPLDPLTRLVLLNCVYFKGLWQVPFSERMTYPGSFHNADGSTKLVSFMEFRERVNFYRDPESGYSFLNLYYKGDRLAMLFVLPESDDQFPELELTSELLCKLKYALRNTTVEVSLPKFKMAFRRELSRDMAQMGITELFEESQADLGGIRELKDVYVSKFMHQAVLEVNEQGSEAAAASGVVISARSGFRNQAFHADHPFGFAIVDWGTDAVLFTGRVAKM